jgi:transcriptional regulator with XRE-family HTH domain
MRSKSVAETVTRTLVRNVGRILRVGNLSAREFSLLARLNSTHVLKVSKGERARVSIQTVVAIAETAGVTLDWLLLDRGEVTDAVITAGIERARSSRTKARRKSPTTGGTNAATSSRVTRAVSPRRRLSARKGAPVMLAQAA